MKIKTLSVFMATVAMSAMTYAQEVAGFYENNQFLNYSDGDKAAGEIEQPTAFDPDFHIYLCFGQSNMEGNAKIEPQDRQNINTRFRMMAAVDMDNSGRKMYQWYAAVPPLCRAWTGLTPADYFGRTLVEQLPSNIKVGVINVAVGGASIDLYDEDKTDEYIPRQADWFKNFCKEYDNQPMRRLMECAKRAQKVGVIKGILLHQGCTDNTQQDWPERVKVVYERMLKELNLKAEECPLLVGELMTEEDGGCCYAHNAIIDRIHETIPTAYPVQSLGCPGQPDKLHFTAQGYRILGRRYAEVMLSLLKCPRTQGTSQAAPVVASAPKAPELEYVCELKVTCDSGFSVGQTSKGERFVIPINGGTFEGPRMKGVVLSGGADYQLIDKAKGRTELEAIYCIRTDDGVNIHIRNAGLISASDGSFYFRTAPKFEAPNGSKYDWLNNALFVCVPGFGQGYISLKVWMVK